VIWACDRWNDQLHTIVQPFQNQDLTKDTIVQTCLLEKDFQCHLCRKSYQRLGDFKKHLQGCGISLVRGK
jgi:hypothetical protein